MRFHLLMLENIKVQPIFMRKLQLQILVLLSLENWKLVNRPIKKSLIKFSQISPERRLIQSKFLQLSSKKKLKNFKSKKPKSNHYTMKLKLDKRMLKNLSNSTKSWLMNMKLNIKITCILSRRKKLCNRSFMKVCLTFNKRLVLIT